MKVINLARGPKLRDVYYDAKNNQVDFYLGNLYRKEYPEGTPYTHHIIVDDSFTSVQLDDLLESLKLPPEQGGRRYGNYNP